ncbi:undecaprenyl/decaprenyl-phosphate alpha-N-acetylglucosaminyl 1-phosphate transferase [bacterium]|nr:undecaprenyl/decaprenyl-phosphate alpha-N-acetylglucosaminyl 1-phosphate transferase [bacterium]
MSSTVRESNYNDLAPLRGTTRKRLIIPTALLALGLLLKFTGYIQQPWQHWLYIFVFSFSLSNLLTPLSIRFSFILGWLDIPAGRKAHIAPTPLLGGAAILGAFGIALIANFSFSWEMKGVGIATTLIWFVGLLDDKYEIPAKVKLLVQVVAVSILIFFNVHVTFMPATWWGDWTEYLITAFWVIGITNAVNFLDGMDGLAAGMSAIISFFLGLVAIQTAQPYFGFVAIALLGSCVGFLPYNFRRSRRAAIFLGDSGSTMLGFALASTVLMGTWAENNIASIIVPILLLGVPIFDMTLTTVIRFATGQVRTFGEWLAYTGRDHFHHRLADLGIGRFSAVMVIYTITFYLGISAVVLKEVRGIDALLVLLQATILFLIITFFMIYVQSKNVRLSIDDHKETLKPGTTIADGLTDDF